MAYADAYKQRPAWMLEAKFSGRVYSALITNEIMTRERLLSLCNLGPAALREFKGMGTFTIEALMRWALVQPDAVPPIEPKPARPIERVVQFQTPDGAAHPTYAAAQSHLSRITLEEWFCQAVGVVIGAPNEDLALKLVQRLLTDWRVSRRKEKKP